MQVGLPLRFRLTGSPNGKADLQLQLLSLHAGDAPCRPGAQRPRARRGRRFSPETALTGGV